MFPTILEIYIPFFGAVPIYSFGFSLLCCFLASIVMLEKDLMIAGHGRELAEKMVTWAAIGGLLGARLLYILSNPSELMADPKAVIFSSAGFVFYGGFIGGVFAVWLLLRRQGVTFYKMSDVVCSALAVGYAVGRIGCQLSGDGDYGSVSSVPWAITYKYGVVPTTLFVHPTPVYESIGACIVLLVLTSRKLRLLLRFQGQLFGLYLVLSSLIRFNIEFLRVEPIVLMGFSQAQVVSVFLFIIGIYMISGIHSREESVLFQCKSALKEVSKETEVPL